MLGQAKPENKDTDNGKSTKKNINAENDTNKQDRYIITPRENVKTYTEIHKYINKQKKNGRNKQ